MALYQYGSSSKAPPPRTGKTEFEILKATHRFLREDDNKDSSWDEQLASKYYESLYREFAVCDLKHYKSGNFALRWRTETEVLSGNGETTCGNTRCKYHDIPEHLAHKTPSLTTLELPFAYVEHGENKSALVKVVLCPKCLDKLMWKRRKEKEKAQEEAGGKTQELEPEEETRPQLAGAGEVKVEEAEVELDSRQERYRHKDRHALGDRERSHRRRSSRSRSPRENKRLRSS